MRKFKITPCGEKSSAPIHGSKEKMQMTRRAVGIVLFRRISETPQLGVSLEMEWDVFTTDELKAIYLLITQEA